jgi:hypothetical protein
MKRTTTTDKELVPVNGKGIYRIYSILRFTHCFPHIIWEVVIVKRSMH